MPQSDIGWRGIAVSALRSLSLAAELFGRPKLSAYVAQVADVAQSEGDVDAHMRFIAEKLADSEATDDDFDDANRRIREDLDRINAGG